MSLVRPTDQGSLLISVNSICDQLEQQARGESPIVANPKVLGSWLETNGVTLGKLATSFSDAPPGYVVASGSFTSLVSASTNIEASATQVVAAGAFTADGTRAIAVTFYTPFWNSSGAAGRANLSLFDGGSSLGVVCLEDFAAAGVVHGPVVAATKITPSAGAHTLSIRLWSATGTTIQIQAGTGGAGVSLPGLIEVAVI